MLTPLRSSFWLLVVSITCAGCKSRSGPTESEVTATQAAPPASVQTGVDELPPVHDEPDANGSRGSARAVVRDGRGAEHANAGPPARQRPTIDQGDPWMGGPGDAKRYAPAPVPVPAQGSPAAVGRPSTAAAEPAIDPNGRFATTYRPGGGRLAAFDAAVARGDLPGADRSLVGDVAGRYVPSFDVPAGKALGAKVDLGRALVAPSGGPLDLRVSLRSSSAAPAARPHLSVHLVLDVSGSMEGASIDNARKAASALVEKLAPSDDFSLTTFSSEASLLVADAPVGAARANIQRKISGIAAGGGTNISAGLSLAYAQAHRVADPDAVRVVFLVSDGRANAGITSTPALARMALGAFQDGIQTSSFGLGPDYDGVLMSQIADDGAGGYYYLRDATQIAPALKTELERRLDPVATAVEIRVRLKPGVGVEHVYGSRRLSDDEAQRVRAQEVAADQQASKRDGIAKDRAEDREGGMRFFIPAFARGDDHAMLLGLRLPEGAGPRDVALVELKYKDRVSKKNVTEEIPVTTKYADSDAQSAGSADASVVRTAQAFAAGEALNVASERIAAGERGAATAALQQREDILRQAADSLHEPLFVAEADRLAALRAMVDSPRATAEPLVLAMLLETAGRSHLH